MRVLSTFAYSTHLEGNPLALMDQKRGPFRHGMVPPAKLDCTQVAVLSELFGLVEVTIL
ncbi:hypothetical protein Poly41_01990 [Novipirellula artificiosorum]|uniref:Uncharacterized protein n=1 Tax=Novipirellula artificiosorum TaxID=2528016 RepID=A0A5C6E3B6_9BACT|nr:hypothetical protein Poly41_01990 [Novipirellula artificiosorum]